MFSGHGGPGHEFIDVVGLGADLAVPGFKILTQIVDDDAATLVADLSALLGKLATCLVASVFMRRETVFSTQQAATI